ncbi:MAG: hypothetical protein HQL68_02960 [Magnetococcales bacterium]|nr:hypothetical protein [Magnetococcales bacterium]
MADQHQDSPKQPEQKASDSGQSEKPDLSPEDQLGARRRKLLKGLLAGVPAIITLQSGAALAGTSVSNAACIAGAGMTGNFFAGGGVTKRCTAVGNIGNDLLWVDPDDAAIWGAANAGPAGAGTEWCLPYLTAGGSLATSGQPAAGQWGANAAGIGTGAWPSTAPTKFYAIKQSCWTSFFN